MNKFLFFFILLWVAWDVSNAESNTGYAKVAAEGGLYLREEANQKGRPVTLLPPGMILKLAGTSDKTEVIGGKKGRWTEVELFGTKGWVFDAYLKRVSGKDSLADYLKYLEDLKPGEFSSLKNAEKKFLTTFTADSTEAENAFRIYTKFVNFQSGTLGDRLQQQLQTDYGKYDTELALKLKAHGLTVEYCEGDGALVEYYDHYWKLLKDYNFPFKEYVRLMKTVGYAYVCDGGIGISWEEMRNRIAKMETFLKEQKPIPEKIEVEALLKDYMDRYANGLDNTPVCECKDEICSLASEPQKSYRNFLGQNKTSAYFSFVEKLSGMYSKSRNRCTEEIRNYRTIFFEGK
ncbi:SH3 domain-containing protein [Leptospira sp. FAT2]|uniref:SH3 domain-containing protein n=1 Tax=Leptospira sanjuanensis TaxID=2879643 RepID=UPI001EE7ACE0|nr:SH3 domain-containing protein [Leptospira sanjuanensis]MCG6193122.1 SH3 domain-containing protein [Leptospira sanjuanensis]